MNPRARKALLLVMVLAGGCWKPTRGTVVTTVPALSEEVEFIYLGAGGWRIEAGGEVLLTAPLFSNPSGARVMLGRLRVDEAKVDALSTRFDLAPAVGILVGHGHYDHAMDLPRIVARHATAATIYGNRTVVNQLLPLGVDPMRLEAVDAAAASHQTMGRWIDVGRRFRIMPVVSRHSSHTATLHFWQGERTTPMAAPPRTAHDWLEGRTYGYVVEIVDRERSPILRVYYNDSGATYPYGFPPRRLRTAAGAPPSVAILTAPGHKFERRYPQEYVDSVRPHWVLVGHWEDFLSSWKEDPSPIASTDFGGFRRKLGEVLPEDRWWVPAPGATFVFRP